MKKPGIALIAAGMLALLAVTGAVLPSKAHASVATPLRHVVVLLQENHSFDSELGFWCEVNPGRCPLREPGLHRLHGDQQHRLDPGLHRVAPAFPGVIPRKRCRSVGSPSPASGRMDGMPCGKRQLRPCRR